MICYIINGRNCKNNLFGCSSDPGNRQLKVRAWGLPVSGQCTLIFDKHLCISVNQVTGTVVLLVVFFCFCSFLFVLFLSFVLPLFMFS